MIRHIVLLRWTEPLSDGDAEAFEADLAALPATIAALSTYEYGADLAIADGNFDYAITATFADADDFVAYRDHPAHQALIATHLAPRVAQRCAAQFDVAG
jgi:hypothetical protein